MIQSDNNKVLSPTQNIKAKKSKQNITGQKFFNIKIIFKNQYIDNKNYQTSSLENKNNVILEITHLQNIVIF